MKALTYYQYGSYDQLQVNEVDKPSPKKNEVLIKVMASSINSWDFDMLIGDGWITRLIGGLFKPRHNILGADVAGVVEAIGKDVQTFKVGDVANLRFENALSLVNNKIASEITPILD